jgi:hypothetical protein
MSEAPGASFGSVKPVKKAIIYSRCECQARLGAELDENKHVIRGWAADIRRRQEEPSPAHSIGADRAKFDVGWLCPFCVRNTLRSFDSGGLAWREEPMTADEAAPG